jgi:hypothetical protein
MLLANSSVISAQVAPAFDTPGFADLGERLPNVVGTPAAPEFATPVGTMQITTTGAVYWHEKTGTVAFTNGYEHTAFVNGSKIVWLGDDDEPPLPSPVQASVAYTSNARVDCIEGKESGGANVANSHGSGAGGVMQYMPGTFLRGATEMGHPEWSLWNPAQARAVAAHDLAMGRRSQWTVSGC